ncbi:class I adenylate-forming enzyme family protein [Stappia indica]|uniref:class I adenylate-forming enzyme family protein n=1 Tax=Stappia indica TaxID=538381 RepID=UPI001CD45F89|nr:AMP-binding protein [Stappia indica]MCA1299780.1 AMP-binding protein [Stappia indica]
MTSIDSWIEAHARFTPDKAAIRFEAGDLTYAQFAAAIGGAAHWLARAHGIGRGDRVAFLGTNAPDMLVLLFAAARLGAILVPLNWRLAPPELAHAVRDSGAALLVHQPAFAATVAEMAVLGAAPRVQMSDARSGGLAAFLAGTAALSAGEGEGGAEDPLLIVYTSGTTGRPKGAVLTQRALTANALNALHMHDMTSRDLVLTVLPMFHVGGLNIQTTPALYAGATVLLHERFHPESCLEAIAGERPDLTVLVPATLSALIAHPRWSDADLSSLRAIATGSSDVPRHLMQAFCERGVPVIQIYGSTETGPVAIYQRVQDAAEEFGAIGRPGLHTEARITRDGEPLGVGEIGEIELRGTNITQGYWNRPEARTESFRAGGWFRTGDLGSIDARGVFWFRDRLKNVIISGGENIYPAELERVLGELSQVAEAAVVGVKDPQWGECPVAVVVARAPQERDAQAVLEGFNGRLARYKHPKSVVFVEELPRNALGKVRLDRVRNMAEDALASGTETKEA